MELDFRDHSETSNDSSSGPEEINNKDAKEVAVASIKAEFACQRLLKENAKKLKIQIELRNIQQKKIKEAKKNADDDSSPPKTVRIGIDDEAVSPGVEETKSEKPDKNIKSKKNKKLENRVNSKNKSTGDSSKGSSQADSTSVSIDKDKPKKLTGIARKKARKRFSAPSNSGKVNKNKVAKNFSIKTEKDTRHFEKSNAKEKKTNVNVVTENKSTEKAYGKKRKFKGTKNDIPKIKSMKTVKVEIEKAD